MNLFGIPICIPYDYYISFLNQNFSNFDQYEVFITSDMVIVLFFILNGLYIYCVVQLIKLFYKICLFVKNSVFR